jgi:hypothetical protein
MKLSWGLITPGDSPESHTLGMNDRFREEKRG